MIGIEASAGIDDLQRGLTEAGFTSDTDGADPTSFGDQAVTFSRGDLQVRAVRDRGQWWIDVAGAATDFYDPDIWRACLEGRAAPLEPTRLADQAAFVLEHLDELAAAARADGTADCLRQRGLERTEGRLRLPRRGRTDA